MIRYKQFREILSSLGRAQYRHEQALVLFIRSNWAEWAGPLMAEHSQVIMVQNGVLFVRVDHPVFSQEIQGLEQPILKAVFGETGYHLKSLAIRQEPLKYEKKPAVSDYLRELEERYAEPHKPVNADRVDEIIAELDRLLP